MLIGEKIQKLRKVNFLTQEDLGNLIGTDGNTVSRWERNKLGVGSSYIAKLARVLNTTTDYLLNGEPEQSEPQKNPGENLPINNAPENNLGLSYWGAVADNAQKVAARGDKEEISLVAALLRTALNSVDGEALPVGKSRVPAQLVGVQGDNNNVKVRDVNLNS